MIRPTFYIDNKPVRAGGVIFYYRDFYNNVTFLMQKQDEKEYLEDIGGRSDKLDLNIKSMIFREVLEESNFVLKEELDNFNEFIYNETGKYILYFVELKKRYPCFAFGNEEIYTKIKRKIGLVKLEDIKNIHPRLRFDDFWNTIYLISNRKIGWCEYINNLFS